MLLALFVAFVFGVLSTVTIEALLFLILLYRLKGGRRIQSPLVSLLDEPTRSDRLDCGNFLHHEYNMQGVVWVLESNKVPTESKKKKDILVYSPEQKHAKVEGHSLVLIGSDGSHAVVQLKGCIVVGVSASESSSKKWAKRYPIKIKSQSSAIYNGSKALYIFCETSWWKESWCRALRFASFGEDEKASWHLKLNEDFISYLRSLKSSDPFLKPLLEFHSEPNVMGNKRGEPPSRAHMLWQKYKKKVVKAGIENKLSGNILSRGDDMKVKENTGSVEKSYSVTGFTSNLVLSQTQTEDENLNSSISRIGTAESPTADEGTVFWNLLLSRLFFDFKSSTEFNRIFQLQVQRILSNMRTPSYIGDVICMGFHIGDFPPYIHDMKAVSVDMDGLCVLDIDMEYSGGAVLDIETRLDVHSVDLRTSIADKSLGSNSERVFTSDCLDEIEHFREQLKASGDADSMSDYSGPNQDDTGVNRGSTQESTNLFQWKSLLTSVAKKVSEVPLSMAVRVDSFRGTLRLRVKPPPSDRLWFGFTSVPDINFSLESSVGDHRITSNQIASFLVNKIKASINSTLVLPNCDSICIPWMFHDEDDWSPRSQAPFLWANPGGAPSSDPGGAPSRNPSGTADQDAGKKKTRRDASDRPEAPGVYPVPPPDRRPDAGLAPSPELRAPLLETGTGSSLQGGNGAPKVGGRRARMLDLGKRMGDKFEEKRRHLEDRSRSFVEKFRGQ